MTEENPPVSAETRDRDNLRGALWIIISCIGATIMSVAVKKLAGAVPTIEVAFLRSVLGIWVLIPILLWPSNRQDGVPEKPRIQFTRPGLHLFRACLFAAAVNFGFHALAELPLATATTLFFLAPIFTTALAALFAGETVGIRRWVAVLAGFSGAMIVLRPGFAELNLAMLAAVGSALCFATALLITRPLAKADGANSIMVSTSVVASILLFIPAIYVWQPVAIALWPLIALLVLTSSLRLFADIKAYAMAEASFLAPFAFIRLLFIVAAGWVFFREGLDLPVMLGAAIIIGSGVFIAHREHQLRKRGTAKRIP